eukprot:3763987-Pyramimonas_sp.AAC.1
MDLLQTDDGVFIHEPPKDLKCGFTSLPRGVGGVEHSLAIPRAYTEHLVWKEKVRRRQRI